MSEVKGTLYGVSVGPGDPELVTLKAARIIREADIVAAPNIGHKRQTALDIVAGLVEGKELMDCSTPMLKDHSEVMKAYAGVADKLAAVLDEGRSIAIICLGDIGVYATYYYIHQMLVERGYDCQVVPGVTSFSAASAVLGIPLVLGPESLTVVPYMAGEVGDSLTSPGTKVFMKSGRELAQLREALEQAGRIDDASVVFNCGLPDEAVYPKLADAPLDAGDYFSLVILKDTRA